MTQVLSPNLSWEFIHNFVVFKKNWCEVIYYEKNSDGKTYPFANVNTSCHFKMRFFWHFEFKKFGIWESTQFCLKTICLWLSSLLNSRLKIWVIETFDRNIPHEACFLSSCWWQSLGKFHHPCQCHLLTRQDYSSLPLQISRYLKVRGM